MTRIAILAIALSACALDVEEAGLPSDVQSENAITITLELSPEQAERFAGVAAFYWLDWYVTNGWNYDGDRTPMGEPIYGERSLFDSASDYLTIHRQQEVRQVVAPAICDALYGGRR